MEYETDLSDNLDRIALLKPIISQPFWLRNSRFIPFIYDMPYTTAPSNGKKSYN
jgi:hypothetical protein